MRSRRSSPPIARLQYLGIVRHRFSDRDVAGRGTQTYDLRTTVHVVTALECALLDLLDNSSCALVSLLGEGQQRKTF